MAKLKLTNMKKTFLLLFIVSAITIVKAQSEKEPWLTKLLSTEWVKRVKARTSGGSISVSGVNASSARIEVYIGSNNGNKTLSKDEIKSRLENYELDISVNDHKLSAIAKVKDQNLNRDCWHSLIISFNIYVPQN